MITYKKFNMYFCSENAPYENLQECGLFVHTISDGIPFDGYFDDDIFETELESNVPQYKDITSVFFGIFSGADDFYNRVTAILPLTTRNQEINNTGVTTRLKFIADNGFYCVSTSTIAAGGTVGKGGGSAYSFAFYNANGDMVAPAEAATSGMPPVCEYGWGMNTITGYDGTLRSGDTFYIWKCGERYNGQFSIIINSRTVTTALAEWYNAIPVIPATPPDPYESGGESTSGGGTGNFDGTGDNIDIPGLPTLSATDTGFITLFNPSTGQLQALANYMWSSGFDLETFKKLFADPMDCILGLSIVPVAVPDGGSKAVSVGNISTGVTMTVAASQYVEVDCGTLNVNEYWGAYLDYDPYTKAEIYLPYIGTHPLAVDDIMGKAVQVVYHIDILSGACTAFVKCGGSVLYEFIGQCSSSIPITGNDWTNVINGVISIAGAIGTMVATGGAAAPMAAGMIASTAVNGMKPNVEKSGSMSGTGGMLAVQVPYLILTRPRQALPSGQNSFIGYPSFITENFSSLSGYTEIESVHLNGIPATEQEISEIESLLKSGVLF